MHRFIALCTALAFCIVDAPGQTPARSDAKPNDAQASALREDEIAKAVRDYLAANPSALEKPSSSILDNASFFADFRLRSESNFKRDDRRDRHRQRIRFRFGGNYRLTDELKFGARIITGNPDDPNSPHVSFGDALNSEMISLDRAFLTYKSHGATVTAGKFNHAVSRNPVYGELVWDADVQAEGLLASYDTELGDTFESLGVTGGIYPLLEQNNGSEAFVSVVEVKGRARLSEDTVVNASAAYYLYTDITPNDNPTLLADNAGNATVDRNLDGNPDAYASQFGILHPVVSVTCDCMPEPITFAAEYMLNARADVDTDEGFAVGVSVGKTKEKGDWRAYYQWQVIEQEAVFSGFAQDDFLFATNHRSHLAGVNYKLLDSTVLHLWSLVSARDRTSPGATTDSDRYQWRVRLDVNVKF